MKELYTGGQLVVKIMEEFGVKVVLVCRADRHYT